MLKNIKAALYPLLIIVFIFSFCGWAKCYAADSKRDVERKKKLAERAKKKLNDTVWEIELEQIYIPKEKRRKSFDTLRFANFKIESSKDQPLMILRKRKNKFLFDCSIHYILNFQIILHSLGNLWRRYIGRYN